MRTKLFDYQLPIARIAQQPMRPRDSSRLLVLERKSGAMEHRVFRDILDYLQAGDVLVMNNTKVFRARLRGVVGRARVEILLVHPTTKRFHGLDHGTEAHSHLPCRQAGDLVRGSEWLALARPGRKITVGSVVEFKKGLVGTAKRKNADGTIVMRFNRTADGIVRTANAIGAIPVPPYIKRVPKSLADYQTVYARQTGSVAAPTAGFHFTPALLKKIRARGVKIAFVTLHVGLGTFQPIHTDRLEDHPMHAEWAQVSPDTMRAIRSAERVIAVGTTTVRALEGLMPGRRRIHPASPAKAGGYRVTAGWVNIFIKPGYRFKIVDALITNFHLPRSTLLALVSAFAGRTRIMRAYRAAVRKKYRFYSFGDAMIIHSR